MNDFRDRYGPWALLSGAATASGAAFARQLAARGLDLVLTSPEAEGLADLARAIRAKHPVEVRPLVLDLNRPGYLESVKLATRDVKVGIYVNADPSCFLGPFVENDLKARLRDDGEIVALNVRAPAALARELGRQMAGRGRGAIIILSATANRGDEPESPDVGAALAEMLWHELAPYGVDVVAVPREEAVPSVAGVPRGSADGCAGEGLPSGEEAGALSSPPVAEILERLGRARSPVPGGIHTPLNMMGEWIFSRDINERLQTVLRGKAARASLN